MVLMQVGYICYGYFMAQSNLWSDFPIKNGEITPRLLHAQTLLRQELEWKRERWQSNEVILFMLCLAGDFH